MPNKLYLTPAAAIELGISYDTLVKRLDTLAKRGKKIGRHAEHGGPLIFTERDLQRLAERAPKLGRPRKKAKQ